MEASSFPRETKIFPRLLWKRCKNVKSGCNSAGERFEVPWSCNKKWTVFFFERENLRCRSRRPCNGRLHLLTIFVYWFGNVECCQNICDVEKNWHLGEMSTWLINNKEGPRQVFVRTVTIRRPPGQTLRPNPNTNLKGSGWGFSPIYRLGSKVMGFGYRLSSWPIALRFYLSLRRFHQQR